MRTRLPPSSSCCPPTVALAAAALLVLAGCAARNAGFGERCASVAESAFPQARLRTAGTVVSVADRHAVIDLRVVRTDVSAYAAEPRDLAVQCRFLDGVLTDFHWTAGPLR
jgi:hypothetical protein